MERPARTVPEGVGDPELQRWVQELQLEYGEQG